ncbi:FapA family protein [bacterium]|nr:FapA family protein [bacterium]
MSDQKNISFEILSYQPDRWLIATYFEERELKDVTLLEGIQSIKRSLAEKVNVPPTLLFFESLVERKRIDDKIKVIFEIIRKKVKGGRSVVRTEPYTSPEGYIIPEMRALIDLYYVDPFDNPITYDKILEEIMRSKVDESLIDFDELEETFEQVVLDHSFHKDYLLAEGEPPDIGPSAEIEYTFSAENVEAKINKLMGVTKVYKDDLLCTVQPALPGAEAGYDIFGKRIDPLPGNPAELIAGNGTRVTLDGTSCFATEDGVTVVTRQDIKRNDPVYNFERTVTTVKIAVEPIRIVDGSSVTDLETEEHLEIRGSLRENARVISKGKVFIDGEVSAGSVVESVDGMVVTGAITGSAMNTTGDFHAGGNIFSSELQSGETLEVRGIVTDSILRGKSVVINEAHGSKIYAVQKVDIGKIAAGTSSGGDGFTRIQVEAKEFFEKTMDQNYRSMEVSTESLRRILELIGPDLAEQIGVKPANTILLQFVASEKRISRRSYSTSELRAFKKLIETAEPLTKMIDTKKEIIEEYRRKIAEAGPDASIVRIRQKITAPTEVTVGDQRINLREDDVPSEISYNKNPNSKVPTITKISSS